VAGPRGRAQPGRREGDHPSRRYGARRPAQLPEAERHLYTEGYLTDTLAVRPGGRVAELIALGEGSTGASNDLAGATRLATPMVVEFGLPPPLGPVSYSTGRVAPRSAERSTPRAGTPASCSPSVTASTGRLTTSSGCRGSSSRCPSRRRRRSR
jgi:ATP-dependent Zn protease